LAAYSLRMKKLYLLYLLCSAGFAADEAGWVVIPINEYRALRIKAYPPGREPEAAPVAATLTRVDYDLKLEGGIASGCATLTVDVLKDGWVQVPIPPGLLVRQAKLAGSPVSLVATGGNSQQAAVLSHRG